MATQTLYKIILNGVLLPDIYFSYDDAKQSLKAITESAGPGCSRIVPWDDETNSIR